MASVQVQRKSGGRAGDQLLACVTEHGSTAHPYLRSDELLKGRFASRNLADLVYFLASLHGRFPGVIDHAANRTVEPEARAWFARATEAFIVERTLLTRLAVAVGPLPSTPGAADSDSVLRAQHHALGMLAQSERNGCALGAAMALVVEWHTLRAALNAAAIRFGVDAPPIGLASIDEIRELADALGDDGALRRAMMFGAEQIALQHRGLCDLLDARQSARGVY
jgi:uncharacterized protein DUF6975